MTHSSEKNEKIISLASSTFLYMYICNEIIIPQEKSPQIDKDRGILVANSGNTLLNDENYVH